MSQDVWNADAVVIGGGVIGVCAAYYLARAGRDVLLLDRHGQEGASSSGNAGLAGPRHAIPLAAPGVPRKAIRWMLDPESPFYVQPRPDPGLLRWLWRFYRSANAAHVRRSLPVLYGLSVLSLELFDELIAEHHIACHYSREGHLVVHRTERGLATGLDEARLLAEQGVRSRAVDRPELQRRLPAVAPDVAGAIHFPDCVHMDPGLFLEGMVQAAVGLGVRILQPAGVLGFEVSGRRVAAVHTARGTLSPRTVVLAAGAWSDTLAARLGLRLPIQPAKGYSITVACPAGLPNLGMLLAESKVAVTRMGERLRFAGTLELAGRDVGIRPRRVRAIERAVRTYLPGLKLPEPEPSRPDVPGLKQPAPADGGTREIWRGLRPCTPDGLPCLGRPSALDNLIIATGHAMIGLSVGPATGKLVAQIAQGEEPAVDLALLRPDRFD
jgi:D-amino-acid dehydrogenase